MFPLVFTHSFDQVSRAPAKVYAILWDDKHTMLASRRAQREAGRPSSSSKELCGSWEHLNKPLGNRKMEISGSSSSVPELGAPRNGASGVKSWYSVGSSPLPFCPLQVVINGTALEVWDKPHHCGFAVTRTALSLLQSSSGRSVLATLMVYLKPCRTITV